MPHEIDVKMGNKIKIYRNLKGMSQELLGNKIGITFQQVQKYESGFNRMSLSRFCQICDILEVPPSFFFEEYPFKNFPTLSWEDSAFLKILSGIDKDAKKVLLHLCKLLSKNKPANKTDLSS